MAKTLGPCHLCETLGWRSGLLILTWSSPGPCGHLGNEQANGSLHSSFLHFLLSSFSSLLCVFPSFHPSFLPSFLLSFLLFSLTYRSTVLKKGKKRRDTSLDSCDWVQVPALLLMSAPCCYTLWEAARVWSLWPHWTPALTHVLGLAWPNLGCHGHLVGEPVDEGYLCLSDIQINDNKWTAQTFMFSWWRCQSANLSESDTIRPEFITTPCPKGYTFCWSHFRCRKSCVYCLGNTTKNFGCFPLVIFFWKLGNSCSW